MTSAAPEAWALFDGACGVCRRGVTRWRGVLERRGIGIAPLQEPWVAARLASLGVAPESALDDFRILVASTNDLISGADAYRFAFRRIWWAAPLYLLSVTPVFRGAFDRGYRAFARNRHRVSRACGL